MLLFYTLSLLSVQILDSIAFLLSVCIHILPKQKLVSTKLFFFLFYCFYDWKHLFINIYQKREIYDLFVVLLLSNIYIKSSVFDTCGIKLYKIMYKDMWKKLFTVLIQWCFLSDLSHHLYDIDVVWSYISAMKIMHNIYIYNEILFIKKSYYRTKYLIYNVLLCRHLFSVHISIKTYSYCTFFILAHWFFFVVDWIMNLNIN